ncbi:cilia- and flagella-associated protein HOATZ [Oncorhynchus tshawytscha]|uniref:Cilia- and flagella-associated protein HOATZ n=2 Tax=Oncorhynchus tshawytscha TaxID=74940 RepID=A0AAZ3PRD3_ONCTS|nr:cilia- and flagella-associated protein HOATZ [Oncorhynchus tshawytscha]
MFESEPRAGITEEEERREAEQLETELDKYFFTVFDGSSPEDVSHAKQLWTSLSLLPPLESRLVNADIRQRLPIARTNHETLLVVDTNAALKPSSSDHRERLQEVRHQKQRQEDRLQEVRHQKQRQEERQRYMDMARRREDIINMLHQQRQKRIQRETVSLLYKPRQRDRSERLALNPQGTWTQTWRRSEGFSNTQTSASEQNQADPCLQELMF